MTKKNFLHYYHKLSGSEANIIFFRMKQVVYMAFVDRIQPRWVYESRESTAKGGYQKFKMRLTKVEKERLIKEGAQPVMTYDELKALPVKNLGRKCELYLHEAYDLGEYVPDTLRFDKGPDVTINGIAYQVKYENASLTNVNVLHKAQRAARGLA